MNVYQSNFNPHYYNQPNHLLISPSSASSIYSGQSLGDEHFYANIDHSNHSLIHMFINSNEPKPDQKALELYPNSAFTSFGSPSPSSSYNSSNGSGSAQMVTNWTPNSQTGQEEPVVLCQLDELTKNLNNNQMNSKKSKPIITLDASYNALPNPATNSDRPKGEPLDLPMVYEPHGFNGHCLPPSEQQFLIQQQFNADLVHQQIAMQQPCLGNGDRASHHIPQSLPPNDHHHSPLSSQIPPANDKSSLSITPSGPAGNKLNPAIGQTMSLNQQTPQSSNQQPAYQANRLALTSCRLKQEPATGGHLLNAIIGYDSEGRPIRNANKKERRRTLSINNAFSNLRDCIPNVPSDTKLSKIKTLRLATSYISYLIDLLDDSSPINGKRNRMMMTCEDFKVDLQRFKGRNKNIHLIYPTKFAEKHFNRKATAAAESVDSLSSQSLSSQSYLSQPARQANFHSTAPNAAVACQADAINECGEMKPNVCANSAIQPAAYNPVPTIESSPAYGQASKRMKGRTGWPQHVIKNVWASERPENAQS